MSEYLFRLKKRRLLSAILAISILSTFILSGCSQPVSNKTSNQSFETFTQKLFCSEVSANTVSLHYTLQNPENYGIKDYPITFGGFSTDAAAAGAAIENAEAALDQIDSAGLSAKNRLTYQILSSYLNQSLEGVPYLLYTEPLSPVNGVPSQIPVLLSEYQFYTEDDVKDYLALMESLPVYFDALTVFEKAKSEAGLFMSQGVAERVLEQCRAFIGMGNDNYLISTFVKRVTQLDGLDGKTSDAYIEANAKDVLEVVVPAYEKLVSEIEAIKGTGVNRQGLCYLLNGKEYYAYSVRCQTGSSKTIPQMQEMTKRQIVEDLEAMEKVLGIDGQQALETVGEIVSENVDNYAANEQNGGNTGDETSGGSGEGTNPVTMLQDLEGKIVDIFPEAPDITTRIKYVPTALESVLSPAFYMIPPIDNTTENVIYVNQSQVRNELSLYTTLAHEGYPGHLYQTVYFANQDPSPIRSILNYGGYVEGWAVYAEMMSYYFSPLSKQQAALLQKNSSIMLGLYSLVDMGIHYDGWSYSQVSQFLSKYGIADQDTVREIYYLILGDPGNYLKYYIGYLEFLEIKKEAMAAAGDSFSQREFHEAVLNVGPAPFDIVKTQVCGEGK